jgi:hypothetical protein
MRASVRRAGFVFAVTSGLLLCVNACKRSTDRQLRDTEGREFSARCPSGQSCTVTQTSEAPSTGKPNVLLKSPGRLIGVCVAPGAQPESPADCRPLVCTDDDGCPPAQGLDRGSCVNELCTEPSHAIGVHDAIMLCLAGTGAGRESAQQVERYAMALNCGEPCRIPSPCRQP